MFNNSTTRIDRRLGRGFLFFCALIVWSPAIAQLPDARGNQIPTLAPVVRETTPSVVNISVHARVKEDNPLYRDPVFREFFDLPKQLEKEVQATGSGVIVDAERGYVLTANHVVAQISKAQVTTKDGRKFDAKLGGRDPATDIAVLQLQGPRGNLKAIPMGDSDKIEVGDFVVAIGNPFGLDQTVTSGIVSALGRTGLGKQGYEDFIQTDASINPGNSGGALINLRGQLIGINTAIISPGGGNVGIGFAVPINMARRVMDQLVQYGEVRRGQIGISIRDLGAAGVQGRVSRCVDWRGRRRFTGRESGFAGGRRRKGGRWHADQKRGPASQFNRSHPARRPRRASDRTQWRCSQRQRRGGLRKGAGETHGRSMIKNRHLRRFGEAPCASLNVYP